MSSPYARAPHLGDRPPTPAEMVPQAGLLIDFDNVTLGRGSDLTKELRTLLNSEIIKGKVAVQRAYADWRRYPQYIVPLSEASIDLIFAPAYGSSKKNATDIRMAIDAMELVFVRPEIGTYILLTGDSDFSSVVLKLKEYGKYVIGVGIEESSSDILVQNCDEYYSYTSLTGLTKTSEAERVTFDPWVLVEEAVQKMTERRDVMRSDRLKQVMREIDKSFNEADHGFPKFSKFLAEASSKGLVKLRKMENGQYEVSAGKKRRGRGRRSDSSRGRSAPATPTAPPPKGGDPTERAYELLRMAMKQLSGDDNRPARDSDVKRRILAVESKFDETELGFPKFSLFLKQAEQDGVIALSRKEPEGYNEVTLTAGSSSPAPSEPVTEAAGPTEGRAQGSVRSRGRRTRPRRGSSPASEPAAEEAPSKKEQPQEEPPQKEPSQRDVPASREVDVAPEASMAVAAPAETSVTEHQDSTPVVHEPLTPERKPDTGTTSRTLHPRQQSGRRGPDGPPPIFEGQGVPAGAPAPSESPSPRRDGPATPSSSGVYQGLPSDPGAIERYLTHRYKGVGEKTAQQVVEAFGSDVFRVMDTQPSRIAEVLSEHRAEALLEAWGADKTRRSESNGGGASS